MKKVVCPKCNDECNVKMLKKYVICTQCTRKFERKETLNDSAKFISNLFNILFMICYVILIYFIIKYVVLLENYIEIQFGFNEKLIRLVLTLLIVFPYFAICRLVEYALINDV